jgi:hypothetical protein
MTEGPHTKKELILEAARQLGLQKWTTAEVDQLRRKLIADKGEAGKSSNEYISEVLQSVGWKVQLSEREEAEERFEEEFEDILHFKTLQDAEVSITRLDELFRRFKAHGEKAAVERVLEIARLGKRRAEMISHNRKVESQKREEKKEIAEWFRIWLETPDAFFNWLEVRKASADFRQKFGDIDIEAEAD